MKWGVNQLILVKIITIFNKITRILIIFLLMSLQHDTYTHMLIINFG